MGGRWAQASASGRAAARCAVWSRCSERVRYSCSLYILKNNIKNDLDLDPKEATTPDPTRARGSGGGVFSRIIGLYLYITRTTRHAQYAGFLRLYAAIPLLRFGAHLFQSRFQFNRIPRTPPSTAPRVDEQRERCAWLGLLWVLWVHLGRSTERPGPVCG